MKKLLITLIFWSGLTLAAIGQVPSPVPLASPAATAVPAVTPALTPAVSPTDSGSSSLADRIRNKVDKKMKHKGGFNLQIDGGDDSEDSTDHGNSGHTRLNKDDIPNNVIPLVGMIMFCLCSVPVLIVGMLLYFGFSRNRNMHKTVRMMVEKGQPVPAALLNPPVHERKRSDARRGVVLMMIGIGLVVFLGAVNDWEGGAWSIGIIPLLIGFGYLLVWRLEPKVPMAEAKADNPPPLP